MNDEVISPTVPATLIIGAGPVGLALAVNLTRHGVPCRLVDKAPGRSTQSKALGVQPRTLEVFSIMEVLEAALRGGNRVAGISVYDHERRLVRVGFEGLDSPCPFVLVLPQSETERILAERLAGLGVAVEREVELTGFSQNSEGVTATLRRKDGRQETFETPWLMGCDGAHSTVRHALGLPFEGAPYEEGFVLADVKIQWASAEDELRLFLDEQGIMGIFPMGHGKYRVVASLPVGAHEDNPSFEWIQALFKQRGPAGAVVSDPVWISSFHIQRRMVPRFREGRVFVLGDAAHIHSPAGGQGMNTGIQDGFNLAWKLALVASGKADGSLLDTFTLEREPVARHVLQLTDAMTHGATLHSPLAQRLRNRILPALAGLGFIRRRFVRNLTEIDIEYHASPIVAEAWPGLRRGVFAGSRAPDGQLADPAGGRTLRLFDLLRGGPHILLLFAGNKPDGLGEISAFVREKYGGLVVGYIITMQSVETLPGAKILLDPDGALHARYEARAASLYVIRPDGYVGFRASPPEKEALAAWLGRIFQ